MREIALIQQVLAIPNKKYIKKIVELLEKMVPLKVKKVRYIANDQLLVFLKSLCSNEN